MDYQNKSLQRAFDIIEALSKSPMTASELAKKLESSQSTIHRFLVNLENRGYTEKMANNQIRLTPFFIQISKRAESHYDVGEVAKPYLKELADTVKESVLISSFHNYEINYIDKKESSHAVRIVLGAGSKVPSYTVASGKLFLSELSEFHLQKFFMNKTFNKYTENTITNEIDLRKELKNIKGQGYAVDNEEYEIGLKGFAVPIRDATGSMVAALSVAGVSLRLNDERSEDAIEALLRYANIISKELGYVGNNISRGD